MPRPAVEVARNLMQRALLMTLYGTGMRRTEVSCPPRQRLCSSRLVGQMTKQSFAPE
jgi:site-specific recombinase XerD